MVTEKELLESMGLAYIPWTFPTITVKNNMAAGAVNVSNNEVNMLWDAYFLGTTEKKLAPFGGSEVGGKGNADILNFIANQTNLGKMKAAAFLNALFKAVTTQGADKQYLDPAGKIAAQADHYSLNPVESLKTGLKDLGTGIGGFLKPVADPITNTVKYVAVGLVAAALIYGIYHGAKLIKLKKKQSRKRA
jgi:hypothetical protein